MHVYEPRHRLELAFYAYAHELRHPSPLRDIHRYLQTERSPNYDLKVNIACAPHGRRALLDKVAAVMANNTIDASPVLDELDNLIKAETK